MNRLTQLREEAGGSRDSTLDASSLPSEAYTTANDGSSSKFFSLSEDDSTFDLSPLKDVSLASAAEPDKSITETEDLISNLSPVPKKNDLLDSYKIGKQIEAANILSGGVNIFDDNDNSYDGDELVIDDNAVVLDDKGNPELKESESELLFQKADDISEGISVESDTVASKDTEVVLQIDGKNVNAIDIGNGLYLYRKEGEEELAAVQIVDDDQQHPSFKFLKVRENAEGNLEVYEEIEIEVPKEVPTKEGKTAEKNTSHVPLKDINKVISDKNYSKTVERKNTTSLVEPSPTLSENLDSVPETSQVSVSEEKSDSIKNSKMMKYNETKKSPFIHSTPNKEGIPLTKVMVNQQLHPNRHSDKVKTIEVHTDNMKQKADSKSNKNKDLIEPADVPTGEKDKTLKICIGMSANENVEVIKNKNGEQDISTSKPIEHNTSASKEISAVSQPLIQKEEIKTNEQTVSKIENIKDTSNIKNDTKTKTIQDGSKDGSKDKKTLFEKYNKKSDADNDQIATLHNNSNDKEYKSYELMDGIIIKSIDNSIEKSNETVKAPIIVNKDIECDLLIEKKESTAAKVEIQMNVISRQETKQNKEHLEKREPEDLKQVESKNLAMEVVSFASDLKNTGKPDVCATDKIKELQSVMVKENYDSTAKELNKNTKCPENKDLIPLNADQKIDKSKNDKQEVYHKIVTADKPDQSYRNSIYQVKKICEDVKAKPLPDPVTMKKFSQVSSLSILNKDKFKHGDKISTDIKESLKLDGNTDLVSTENNEKSDAVITQASTGTSNVLINKQEQTFESFSVDESHSKETSNHETTNKNPHVNPVLASVQIKQTEIGKKVHTESIPATLKVTPIKSCHMSNESCHSESEDISIKIAESKQKQHIPIKPMADNTIKTKADAVTQEKIENDLHKINAVYVENLASSSVPVSQIMPEIKKDLAKEKAFDKKPINNISSAVPFGKWTEANRQEFLNKIKESKVPSSSSNANQIKQPNDLNRRDVLQKIDSQRQLNSAAGKIDLAAANKLTVNNEIKKKSGKPIARPESKIPVKTEELIVNRVSADRGKNPKQEIPPKHFNMPNTTFSVSACPKTESATQRTGIYNQDLIDRTIEDIINRAIPGSQQDDKKSSITKECKTNSKPKESNYPRSYQSKEPMPKSSSLDVIEMQMNELHGIPFVERPPHELPKVYNKDIKTYAKQEKTKSSATKVSKIPNLVQFASINQAKVSQEKVIEVDSEEEIIEHEPITGDIGFKNVNNTPKPVSNQAPITYANAPTNIDKSKKETIITENDFDKFARRNSITYENCLTVNFEDREKVNVVHTVKEKDVVIKPFQTEQTLANKKHNISPQQLILHQNKHSDKIQLTSMLIPVHEDMHNKNYPSKLQMAYQSALTAKRHTESPITIIEDRPVKVVYMDVQSGFTPNQIYVQGKDLSPTKKPTPEAEITTAASCDSMDSDMLETIIDVKCQDKAKIKHQRKQVLTPVDTPELELIEPSDLVVEPSPKKKRKTDDKSSKVTVPKKSYLLGRGIGDDSIPFQDLAEVSIKEAIDQNNTMLPHDATASAIDNLVKAAELLETQSGNLTSSAVSVGSDSQKSTPAKRGRGRPRKYPVPDGSQDKSKTATQKKPRLIDAKKPKVDTVSDDDDSSDEGIVQENWTMGKIKENIVCPICNKLFRSENVVFKHVKHCTGPSPNRSESDKRSPSRMSGHSHESDSRYSQDSKSDDVDYEPEKTTMKKETPKKLRSKEFLESNVDKQQVVVIEDSPTIEKPQNDEPKQHESRKRTNKSKVPHKVTNLACEICGKTFRQLSYLVNHKLQHEKDVLKKTEAIQLVEKSVFTCEICKKEFRKLHHMVQHRLIHNPGSAPSRNSRKSSCEQNISKEQNVLKQSVDQSAAFRCEPCDKSFRKLHHLVEHRETHDGINRQKGSSNVSVAMEKSPPPPPECDICKKRFRKLHHLIEHKEQHQETSSEKSDDRSVKSALSTKDIIHECSLCYMVFPNEHSLNKHSIICQRKKRQLAAKQNKCVEKSVEDDISTQTLNDTPNTYPFNEANSKQKTVEEKSVLKADGVLKRPADDNDSERAKKVELEKVTKTPNEIKIVDRRVSKENDLKILNSKPLTVKRDSTKSNELNLKATDIIETSNKRKFEDEKLKPEVIVMEDTPKKKTPIKDKVALTMTKRKKTTNLPLSIINEDVPISASSDDEEVRYMLNPNFKAYDTTEGQLFMKVRAKKRNSLQIERPNSKNERRTLLQQPLKISRQKSKPIEAKISSKINTDLSLSKNTKTSKLEPIPSDSDDSDVKYSFPEIAVNVTSRETAQITKTPKLKLNSLKNKRKSLGSKTKRNSLGKVILPKLKVQAKPAAGDPKIRRRQEVDYRCDCGQLFHSAALLARHTTLAHTPPRIRRHRSPPSEKNTKSEKSAPRKSASTDKPTISTDSRKSSVRSDTIANTKPKKSVEMKSEAKTPGRKRKATVVDTVKSTGTKSRTTPAPAHRGVPVPEKMKKLLEKLRK